MKDRPSTCFRTGATTHQSFLHPFHDGLDPEFEAAVQQAIALLESAGAVLREVHLPTVEHAVAAQSVIAPAEAATVHEERIRSGAHLFGPDARNRIELGSLLLATDYLKAQRVRAVFQREFALAMEGVDVLVAPTCPGPPARLDMPPRAPSNGGRSPAFATDGIPVGLQTAGRPMDEESVLMVAHAYEQMTDWHTSRPPMA